MSIAIIKAINRRMRKEAKPNRFNYDYTTWCVTHPQISFVYNLHAEKLIGRKGRFLPPNN